MLNRKGERIRAAEAESAWVRSFDVTAVKCLVVCRGPVRKEAFDVFDEIGVREYGMLLSEKDSVVYPRCLAPELRSLRFPSNVHRVARLHGRRPGGEARPHPRDHRDRRDARLHAHLRRLRLHGRGRRLHLGDRGLDGPLHRPLGPRAAQRRREGRGQEARPLARQRRRPGRRQPVRPGAARARQATRRPSSASPRSTASTSAGIPPSTSLENAERLLQAGYAKIRRARHDRRAPEDRRARIDRDLAEVSRAGASATNASAAAAARDSASSPRRRRPRRR